MSVPVAHDLDYTADVAFQVPRERLFDALTTLTGLGAWWTPIVSGSASVAGEIEFGFNGLDEKIVMRVEQATPHCAVVWTCLTNTGHPEWQDTQIVFDLLEHAPGSGLLKFRHIGLAPDLDCYSVCERGWDHFLASLVRYAEHGEGRPF
jgi:uncharacterized protein YndB with AHSA1/START domain